MNPEKYVCPACKKKTGVSILYGMPSSEMFAQEKQGEIFLGGCCVDMKDHHRKCIDCGHEWRVERKKIKWPPGIVMSPEAEAEFFGN